MDATAAFFNSIRTTLFNGKLTQSQVDGINNKVTAFNELFEPDAPIDKLAYILATSYHETGKAMQPVEERGKGAGKPYGMPDKRTGQVYYGRGDVQLTWYDNYVAASNQLGVDLTNNPTLALDPMISARVITRGMRDGWFTGKKLASYFGNNRPADAFNARRIVNGTDDAELIADYWRKFQFGLTA